MKGALHFAAGALAGAIALYIATKLRGGCCEIVQAELENKVKGLFS